MHADLRASFWIRHATLIGALAAGPAAGMTVTKISPYNGLGVAVASGGEVWATQPGGYIFKVDLSGVLSPMLPLGPSVGYPQGIVVGADGNLWFGFMADAGSPQAVGRMTPTGVVTTYPIGDRTQASWGGSGLLANAPDGTVWFTLMHPGGLGTVRPGGLPELAFDLGDDPSGLALGRDGTVWYTVPYPRAGTARIGRIPAGGYPQEVLVAATSGAAQPRPNLLAEGADGVIWVADLANPVFHRISPSGFVQTVPVPGFGMPAGCMGLAPFIGIAAARDGNVWAVGCKTIARITPAGQITTFPFEAEAFDARTTRDGNVVFAASTGMYLLDPLAMNDPDFSLGLTPAAVSMGPAGAVDVAVVTSVRNGFDAPVALSVAGLPAGVSATIAPSLIGSPGSGTARLSLRAEGTVVPGSYPVTVSAAGGGATHSAALVVTVVRHPPVTRVVPIVLDVVTDSAHFRTHLTIANRSDHEVAVTAHYVPSLGQRSGTGSAGFSLAPRSQRQMEDAVDALRGLGLAIPQASQQEPQGGTLRLVFDGDVTEDDIGLTAVTASPTSAPNPSGFAGLAYAGYDLGKFTNSFLYVFGLRSDANDRSNLAVVNGGPEPVSVRVTLFSGTGDGRRVILRESETLGPFAWLQYSGVLESVGMTNGYALLERVSPGGTYSAYGVVNDNVTNDGSFVPASLDNFSGTVLTVPVVVETSQYRTELLLANRGTKRRPLTLAYTESAGADRGREFRVVVTLEPGEQRIIPEATRFLREQGGGSGAGETFAGSVRITTDEVLWALNEVFAGTRVTKALPRGGRVGVFLPAVYAGEEASDEAFLFGLRAGDRNRTNVAVVNCATSDGGPVTVTLDVLDGDTGSVAGSETVSLGPGGWTQVPDVLRRFGVQNGWIRAHRTAGRSRWIAYAVVNDGAAPDVATDDGAAVPMVKPRRAVGMSTLQVDPIAEGAAAVRVRGLEPGSTVVSGIAGQGGLYTLVAEDGSVSDDDRMADGTTKLTVLNPKQSATGAVWSVMDQTTLACATAVVGQGAPAPPFPGSFGPMFSGSTEIRIDGLPKGGTVVMHQGVAGGGWANALATSDGSPVDADGVANGTIVITHQSMVGKVGNLLRFPLAGGDRIQFVTGSNGGGASCVDVIP